MTGRASLPFLVLPTKNIRLLEIDRFPDNTYHTQFYFKNGKSHNISWPTRGIVNDEKGSPVLEIWEKETEGIINNLIKIVGNSEKRILR